MIKRQRLFNGVIIMAIREISSETAEIGESLAEDTDSEPHTICVECQTPIEKGRVFHERGEPKCRDCLQGWGIA